MIIISNIKLELDDDIQCINEKIRKRLKITEDQFFDYEIIKESIDARKGKITFVYQVLIKNLDKSVKIYLDNDIKRVTEDDEIKIIKGDIKLNNPPIVIGFGPSGIFAALTLAKHGYNPIVFEMGSNVDKRTEDVEKFWNEGILNEKSNVQFGEGGAGTFSDGKLTTRIKDLRVKSILTDLHKFGGPEDIVYSHKAHIGTDVLKDVVKNLREEIIKLGGKVYFDSKMEDMNFGEDGNVKSIVVNGELYQADAIILAIGNSARETYKLLHSKNVSLFSKPFAVGFRIEHPRVEIDKSQYKENYDHPKLKSASYNLTYKASNGKNCYTFCMCPGGKVIAASSAQNQIVVNGMSYHSRDEENSNSAILCSVNNDDYGMDVLSGIDFQDKIERKTFELGGGGFIAPVQKVEDFLAGKPSKELGTVTPSYTPGYKLADMSSIYSDEIILALRESLMEYEQKISAFRMKDAILTGVETRSSSPVRIVRDDNLMAVNNFGLFPTGEGAGYSGGIMSSAVDGMKCAEALISKFNI